MRRIGRLLVGSARGMARHRLRTGVMMLGTFVGVTALTVVVALGSGTQRELRDRVDRLLSGSTLFVRAGGGQMVGGPRAGAPATTTLTLDDLRAVAEEVPHVELVDPMLMAGERDVVYDGRNRAIRVFGHSEAAEVAWNRPVTRGAYFTADDVASAARVALVGEVVARELFDGRDPIGEQIRIGSVPFRILGVLDLMGVDPHGLDKDDEIVIPITTMMRRVLNIDYVMGAKVVLARDTDLDAAVLAIGDFLRRRHALGPDQPDDFGFFTPEQARQVLAQVNRVFTVFLPLSAGIAILVGTLVAATLMLMAVNERRAEIGLRQAVGARPRDIRLQFLAEAVAVTGLGGVLAILTGYGTLKLIVLHGGASPGMPWQAVLLGLGVAVATGVVAGVVPARRAAALRPTQTLR